MNFEHVPSGFNIPENFYNIIEIPAGSGQVKYEFDKNIGAFKVDRFMSTSMVYPCNYGFINKTLGLDGDPIDALTIT